MGLLIAAASAGIAVVATNGLPGFAAFGSKSEARNMQVINSVAYNEEVVLLSLGIQGISEKNQSSTFLGMNIPGSSRASFLQYSFNAKLGIDGGDVNIAQTGEDEFLITVPEFIFIGHDDESFRLVAENNGVLSWVTPEADTVAMINDILDDDGQEQYVQANAEILQTQAEAFYTSIINSIDEDIDLSFEFTSTA